MAIQNISTADMAFELAEREYLNVPFQYVIEHHNGDLSAAWGAIMAEWSSLPEQDIRDIYRQMKGDTPL